MSIFELEEDFDLLKKEVMDLKKELEELKKINEKFINDVKYMKYYGNI